MPSRDATLMLCKSSCPSCHLPFARHAPIGSHTSFGVTHHYVDFEMHSAGVVHITAEADRGLSGHVCWLLRRNALFYSHKADVLRISVRCAGAERGT